MPSREQRFVYFEAEHGMTREHAQLLVRGERLMERGQHAQALVYFEEVLTRYPSCIELLAMTKQCYEILRTCEATEAHGPDLRLTEFHPPGTLLLLEFTRHPAEFQRALLEGSELRGCRDLLAQANLPCELSSGAKVFVRPSEYPMALAASQQRQLRPFHVVISADLESLLQAAVCALPCRSKVRVRNKEVIYEPHTPRVERSFLVVAEDARRQSTSVTQSTTEAHGGMNPRRLELNRVASVLCG
eukprot:TRINITY_DN48736_c0_g1_i1.p1 TRINITY_DN48736_c0_g1~~TRINITY_DN48736_c0_g1_i1.p1  ORF type:complete len:245 (-),score=37.35 TRINITY_DN48736_c0_g1_i1:24-758(-)